MGEGYHVLIWDGWGVGLNMVNPRLLHDEHGNNWWPIRDGDRPKDGTPIDDEWITDFAIKQRQLPWQDDGNPDWDVEDGWEGSRLGSQDYKYWRILR